MNPGRRNEVQSSIVMFNSTNLRMSRILPALVILVAVVSATHCRSTGAGGDEEVELTDDAGTELRAVRELYAAPDCYLAAFTVRGNVPGEGEREARGSIRADNINQRMLLIFRDPFLGITLSRLVVKDGQVYLSNPRTDLYSVPLEQFELRGMGNNAISLPFSVFQDLLYARLPQTLFTKKAKRSLEDAKLSVVVDEPQRNENYRYDFVERRLREIRYKRNVTDVQIQLDGTYGDTVFPRTIEVATLAPTRDRMYLRFTSINPNVSCRDSHFSER